MPWPSKVCVPRNGTASCWWYRYYRENVVQILTSKNGNGLPRWLSGKEPACQCRRQKRRSFHSWVRKIPGEGNGNPLQCSCLGNPRDGGAWWAAVYGVAQSRTRLKRLSSSSSSRHISFIFVFFFFFWPYHMTWEILVFQPGIKPMPLHWKHEVLTTGPLGKSQ